MKARKEDALMEAKTNDGSLRLIETKRGTQPGAYYGKKEDVPGTFRIFEGILSSGKPFRGKVFIPDRTPEEQARRDETVRAACREYVDDYIKREGRERAVAVLGV